MDTRKESTGDQDEAVANKQPGVAVAPVADETDMPATPPIEPVAQVNGANEPTTTRKPLEPVLDLRVHRTNTSQEDLDEEAIILMRTIRETISNTNTLMGHLATKPGVFHPFENEVAMLDATTAYLTSILGPSAAARATPTGEQKLRRIEIQNRQDEAIKKLRRLPMREKEGEVVARAPQPEEVVPAPSVFVPNPEWYEPFGYRGKVPLRDTFKRLVGSVAPGPEIFGVRHEPEPRGDVRMRLRRCVEMEQQSATTREAQREEVARSPTGVSGRSELFDFGGSASLNAYLRKIMANKGGSQGGCGPNHEQQAEPVEKAEPDQRAELEVDDSGLDGVGWLYEVD